MPRHRKNFNTELKSLHFSAGFRGGLHLSHQFFARSFLDVTYVQGETLKRFWRRPELEVDADGNRMYDRQTQYFLVYTPTHRQIEHGCDRCPTTHRPLNLACSMNTQRQVSTFVDESILYNFVTPVAGPNYMFEIIEEFHPPGRAKVYGVWARLTKK